MRQRRKDAVQSLLKTSKIDGQELLTLFVSTCLATEIDVDILRLLVQQDPSIVEVQEDEMDRCTLWRACLFSNMLSIQIIKLFHELNPDLYCKRLLIHSLNLLSELVNNTSVDAVELLLSLCPESIRQVNDGGELPIHVALQTRCKR